MKINSNKKIEMFGEQLVNYWKSVDTDLCEINLAIKKNFTILAEELNDIKTKKHEVTKMQKIDIISQIKSTISKQREKNSQYKIIISIENTKRGLVFNYSGIKDIQKPLVKQISSFCQHVISEIEANK